MKNRFRDASDKRLSGLKVDEALRRRLRSAYLDDEVLQKPRHRLRPALALALGLLLLTAAAFALTRGFGLIDLLRQAEGGRVPIQEQVQEGIRQDLASHRFPHTEVAVKEALYDGRMLRVLYSVQELQAKEPLGEPSSTFPHDFRFEAALKDGISWSVLDYCWVDGHSVDAAGSGISVAGPEPGQSLTVVQFDLEGLDLGDSFEVLLPLAGPDTPRELAFTLSATDLKGIHQLPLPSPLVLEDRVLRLTRVVFSPMRVYVDMDIEVAAGVPEEVCHEILWRWTLDARMHNPFTGQAYALADTATGYAGNTEPDPGKGDFRHRILDESQPVTIRIHLEFESPGDLPDRLQLSAGEESLMIVAKESKP